MDKRNDNSRTVKAPYFSIILPAYNVPEKYLRECMESLSNQTYSDYEIIFVDDGSTDRTGMICESFSKEYPHINVRCIHQMNGGQISARMNGFDHSNGDYLLFFDSDDTIQPNTLERIKNTFERYNCDIVMFNAVRDYGERKELFWDHYRNKETLFSEKDYSVFLKTAVSSDRLNNVWLKSFKRSIIETSERYDDKTKVRLGEDFLMQLPWFDKAKSVVYIPENLYSYRFNSNSIMVSSEKKFDEYAFENALTIFNEQTKYANKWGIADASKYSNRKFFAVVSTCLKQIRFCKKSSNINLQLYLKNISSDSTFRKEYTEFEGKYCPSQFGRILIVLTYYKLYYLVILLARIKPSIHGRCIK